MVIYCSFPIRGEKPLLNIYNEVIKLISSLGHTALSELNEDFKPAAPLTDPEIFTRDIKWIDMSKMLIAEVSGASTGVGFEIAYALYKKKIPALALINNERKSEVSAMITGCSSNLITVTKYQDQDDLTKIIKDFIKKYDT
jgi:hypothetical protein